MNITNNIVFKLAAIIGLIFICGCEYAQTLPPQFNDNKAAAIKRISSKFGFEDIDIKGFKKGGGNGPHTLLTIKLINCKNVPANDQNMYEATKEIAQLIKVSLNDQRQFECYKVLFVEQQVDGMNVTNKYVGHNFQPGEI